MDYETVSVLFSVLAAVGVGFVIFIVPALGYLLSNLSEESHWRTRKIISDLGYVRVKKKFLFFKYEVYRKVNKDDSDGI